MRLPNYDICPKRYVSYNWKGIHHVRNKTFRHVDLKGFCMALAEAAGLRGALVDVQVGPNRQDKKVQINLKDYINFI